MKRCLFLIGFLAVVFESAPSRAGVVVVDFEGLPTQGGFYNGDPNQVALRGNYSLLGTQLVFGETEFLQQWQSGGLGFNNENIPAFGSWSGWSWSNVVDTTTPGFLNQYAAFPGGGSNGAGGTSPGSTYAMAFGSGAYINLPIDSTIISLDLSNATYAAISMRDGDSFSKRFGSTPPGPPWIGTDFPDFFRVTITGYTGLDGSGAVTGAATFDLADFTFANNSQDYILDDWLTANLTSLGNARSLAFDFDSSDVGTFGINTPLFLAVDNVRYFAVPEPSSAAMLAVGLFSLSRRRRNRCLNNLRVDSYTVKKAIQS
jgi:hypothetical protein